jgi:hypothetical protein
MIRGARIALGCGLALAAACSGSKDQSGAGGTTGGGSAGRGAGGTGVAGSGIAGSGIAGSGVAGSGTAGSGIAGSGAAGTGAAGSGASAGAAGTGTTSADLCAGMITDQQPHTMTALAKPAVGATVRDAQFGTTIRRITAVSGTGASAAIVPMYTTISAFNADESRLILYAVGGGHQLYDGKTYQLIKPLAINPADVEQVYWDTADPDLLYYVDTQSFIRYHVSSGTMDKLHDFGSVCGVVAPSNGDDPMFTSWDSHRLGLTCASKMFIYDSSTDTVLGPVATPGNGTPPGQVAPSGTLAFLEAGAGQVLDTSLTVIRSLGLSDPANHASLGRLANGHDTWNGAVYDDANNNVGILVTWDMTNATGGVVIGPKTGWPYPPDGHVSAMAYRRPGWIFVSTFFVNGFDGTGTAPTPGLLDLENLIADTNTGTVCRVGRHRSWGKANQTLGYWAEAHTVPSPSGTRAVFASDWGGGASVDTYVLELPAYTP